MAELESEWMARDRESRMFGAPARILPLPRACPELVEGLASKRRTRTSGTRPSFLLMGRQATRRLANEQGEGGGQPLPKLTHLLQVSLTILRLDTWRSACPFPVVSFFS